MWWDLHGDGYDMNYAYLIRTCVIAIREYEKSTAPANAAEKSSARPGLLLAALAGYECVVLGVLGNRV